MTGHGLLSAVSASLWLGGLLVPAALLMTRAWPRITARQRYVIWWVVLIAIVCVPWLPRGVEESRVPSRGSRKAPATAAPVSAVAPGASTATAPAESDAGPPASSSSWSLRLPAATPRVFLLVWIAGSLLGLLGLLRELAILSSIRRSAEPPGPRLFGLWRQAIAALPTRRVLRLLVSDRVPVPAACGYHHPAVLMPRPLEGALDDDELRHLLLHELAHLARRDDWSLAIERVIRVLCWWHPAVWWIGGRLDAERELACDEAVASRVDRRTYARTLVRVAELSVEGPGPALAPAAMRGALSRRVESLVRPAPAIALRTRATAAGGALVALAGVSLGPPAFRLAVRAVDPSPVMARNSPLPVRSDSTGLARGQAGVALDSIFTRYADSGFSGTVLVAFGDQVILEKGYGLADRERGIAATAETRYSSAGITKLFTAAAVLRLEAEGQLSVEDSLARWAGDLPAGKRAVTLHQLLTHTDGLTRQSAPVFRVSAEGFVRAVGSTPSAFAPGAGYRYNDFGHSLLGVVVEQATGTSYEEYIRHRFLKPAGLTHTGFESDRMPIAVEYGGDRGETRLAPRAYVWGRRGSLGLVTTAGDLYRWFRAMGDPAILPPEARSRMLESRVKTDWGAMQGYGWDFHHRADGRVIWRRVAGTPGFEGEILHDPAGKWTAVILVNSRIGWRFKVWDVIERAALLSAADR